MPASGQLFLCSHDYQSIDVLGCVHLAPFLRLISIQSTQIAVVTSDANTWLHNLFTNQSGRNWIGWTDTIVTSGNSSAIARIQDYLREGGAVFIFYERWRMSSGVWHILKALDRPVQVQAIRLSLGEHITPLTWRGTEWRRIQDNFQFMWQMALYRPSIEMSRRALSVRRLRSLNSDGFKRYLFRVLYR